MQQKDSLKTLNPTNPKRPLEEYGPSVNLPRKYFPEIEIIKGKKNK